MQKEDFNKVKPSYSGPPFDLAMICNTRVVLCQNVWFRQDTCYRLLLVFYQWTHVRCVLLFRRLHSFRHGFPLCALSMHAAHDQGYFSNTLLLLEENITVLFLTLVLV